MDVTTMLRRVKREFGDEYNVVINDSDIFDWANEAQLNIIRDTTSNDISATRVVNTFPISLSDKVSIKRVAVNNRALQRTTLEELDLLDTATSTEGTPLYWYVTAGQVHLWPVPKITDAYNVIITYSKIPTKLSLVAPYLQFQNNPPSSQYMTIPADADYNWTGTDFYVDMTLDKVNQDFYVVAQAVATVNLTRLVLLYLGSSQGAGKFQLVYSNGTASRSTAIVTLSVIPVDGTRIKIRVKYIPATGVTNFYQVDSAGVETLFGTDDQADAYNLNATSYAIIFGAGVSDASTLVTPAPWKLHYFKLNNAQGNALVEFDGTTDLATLPTVPASPFTLKSGQTATVSGGIQVYNPDNTFSVPEAFHDDIIKYCLAKAHRKNRDYRGAEDVMEEFNQSVSSRRHTSQADDAPAYKLSDPHDYGWDYIHG